MLNFIDERIRHCGKPQYTTRDWSVLKALLVEPQGTRPLLSSVRANECLVVGSPLRMAPAIHAL